MEGRGFNGWEQSLVEGEGKLCYSVSSSCNRYISHYSPRADVSWRGLHPDVKCEGGYECFFELKRFDVRGRETRGKRPICLV